MTAPVITADKLVAAVRDFAAAEPSTKIAPVGRSLPQMLYVHRGQPYCLIGQALSALGLINATLEGQWHANRLGIKDLLTYLCVDGTDDDIAWLRWAQWYQDMGDCWGSAISKADDCVTGGIDFELRWVWGS